MSEENKLSAEEQVNVTSDSTAKTADAPVAQVINEDDDDKNTKYMTEAEFEQAKLNQNFPVAIIAGLVTGIVCAALWAAVTVVTGHIYSLLAILLGLAVGFVIKKTGKAVEMKFGIAGAAIALLSLALGNFFGNIAAFAYMMGTNFFDILFNLDYSQMPALMRGTASALDYVFYGLAVVSGFTTAYHKVKIQ